MKFVVEATIDVGINAGLNQHNNHDGIRRENRRSTITHKKTGSQFPCDVKFNNPHLDIDLDNVLYQYIGHRLQIQS
jgi:hypothetical protein